MPIAKVFWSGRSQAVRLPKAFRFDADTVRVRKHGAGVILEPVADDWEWLVPLMGAVDDDFAAGASERPPEQVRPGLDVFE